MKTKELFKLVSLPVIGASLCCLSPLLLFLLGAISLTAATEMTDLFYGEWKWAFRGAGLVLLVIFLVLYFRKKGVCTLDQAKRQRNKIINTVLIVLFVSILAYIFFLYVVVHYWGVWLDIWE
jgi:hypothetical protein